MGGLLFLLLPSERKGLLRWSAFLLSLVPFFLSLILLLQFDRTSQALQWMEKFPWIPVIGVDYFLAVDGLSLGMIFLTTFLTSLAILTSFSISIEKNLKTYLFQIGRAHV